MIVHICPRDDWAAAVAAGELRPPSIASLGFVHCSDPSSVHIPAQRLFAGRTDVLLLVIDESRLTVPVRWERGIEPNGRQRADELLFPHVYGPIPVSAVIAVHDYRPDASGTFIAPSTLTKK
ncbi:MAG: DUF952 domain-containing protein [Sciscionella sp.]|nr:DUF952 domain-containing protein [Sciscionella sp.]